MANTRLPGQVIRSGSIPTTALSGGVVSRSVQVNYAEISNIPTGIISGSTQLPAGILSSSTQINNLSNVSASFAATAPYSGLTSIPSGIMSSSTQTVANIANQTISPSTITATGAISGSGLTTTGNSTIGGNLTVSGILTAASQSIAYISSSQLNVGTNIVTVNVQNPTVRFGGLAVIDSGSSPQRSGSLLFDSQNDQWIFVHQNQTNPTSSVLLMGPQTYNNIGNETNLTNNYLLKSVNAEHVGDSIVYDNGTNVGIGTASPSVRLHVVGSSILANNTSIDPDSYTNTVVAGNISDTGWGVTSGIGGNAGTGDSWAIGHNGSALFMGMQNGVAADSMQTYMRFDPNRNVYLVETSGNVGVGTTTPISKLTVTKAGVSVPVTDDASNNAHLTLAGSNALVRLQFGTQNVSPFGGWIQASYDNTGGANGVEPLLLNPIGGNVGIGTTSPTSTLTLGSNVGTFNGIGIGYAANSDIRMGQSAANNIVLAWKYNATAASAYALLETFGGSNPLGIQVTGGNVGIGTISPSYKLDVAGTIGLSGSPFAAKSGNYIAIYEQASNAAISLGNATDPTNYYDNSVHQWRNRGGGTDYMRLNSVGNLGIGTINPSVKLEVKDGNILVERDGSAGSPGSWPVTHGLSVISWAADGPSTDTAIALINAAAGRVSSSDTYANNAYLLRLAADDGVTGWFKASGNAYIKGNLGIGTTSPGAKLAVEGTALIGNTVSGHYVSTSKLHIGSTSGTTQLSFEDVGVSTAAIALDGNNFSFGHQNAAVTYYFRHSNTYNGDYANTGTAFVAFNSTTSYINSTNVGIGTTTPAGLLTVYSGSNGALGGHILISNNGAAVANETAIIFGDGGSAYHRAAITTITENSPYHGAIAFKTGIGTYAQLTETVRITGAGSVGIGTSFPSAKLDVYSATDLGSGANGIRVHRPASYGQYGYLEYLVSSDQTVLGSVYTGAGSSAYGKIYFRQHSSTTSRDAMVINSSGHVGIGTTSPNAELDIRGNLRVGVGSVVNDMGATRYVTITTATIGQSTGVEFYTADGTYNPRAWITHTHSTGAQALTFNSTYSSGTGYANFNFLNGNVGIGTTSPSYPLHIKSTTTNTGLIHLGIDNVSSAASLPTRLLQGWNGYYNNGSNGHNLFLTSNDFSEISSWEFNFTKTWSGVLTFGVSSDGTQITRHLTINSSGNVGIGTSSPSARLHVSSSAQELSRFQSSNTGGAYTTWYNGSIASLFAGYGATLSSGATNNDGVIRYNSSYNLIFSRDGAEVARFNSSGNFGIGTTSPTTNLEIYGGHTTTKARLYSTGDGASLNASLDMWASEPGVSYDGSGIGNNVNGHPYYGRRNSGFGQAYIRFYSGQIFFDTDTTDAIGDTRLFIGNTGNVGIATTSPGRKLDVVGRLRFRSDGSVSSGVWHADSSGNEDIFVGQQGTAYTDSWGVYSNGSWRLVVARADGEIYLNGKAAFATADSYLRINQGAAFSSGVWFGSTPNIALGGTDSYMSLGSNGGTTTSRIYFRAGTYNGSNVMNFDGTTGNAYFAGNLSVDGTLGFRRGSGDYGTYIKANGYPGQGYANSDGTKYWVELGGAGGVHVVLNTDGGAGSVENAYDHFTVWQGSNSGDRLFYVTNKGNTTVAGGLGVGTGASTTAGEIRATNEITAYYSDARLKNFHGRINNSLTKVTKLNGYYFTENEVAKSLGYTNDKIQIGLSAQEVQAVLPEAVVPAPIDDMYLTVKYEKLVPLLIEAIKEQQVLIQQLQEQVNVLSERQ